MKKEIQSKAQPLLVLLCFGLLIACSDYEPAEMVEMDQKVYVREFESGKPIENAKIVLVTTRYPTYEYNPNGVLRDFATHATDSTGMVHLKGRMQKITYMKVYAPSPKRYFDAGDERGRIRYNSESSLTESFIANPVFALYPRSWLQMSVDFRQLGGGYDEVRFTSDQELNGSTNKSGTTVPILVKGNVLHQITFEGFKGGERIKSWVQEVYIPGHDTLTHQVDAYLLPGR
jgi:hypothetical protein